MKLLKSDDVAARLGISVQTARRWMRSGTVPAVRIGSFWYVSEAELEKIIHGEGGENHGA